MTLLRSHVFTLLAALVALVLPLLLASGSLATELLVYAMAAMACNLLLGWTGLMSFGQGIFFGLGSYAVGLLVLHLHASMTVVLLGAVVAGALAAALVGWFAIRQRGVQFVMLTLAFAQLFYFLAYSQPGITGGDNGLLDIARPAPRLGGHVLIELGTPWRWYAFVAVVFVLVFAGLQQVAASRFGRTLRAIRANEARAAAVGYDVRAFKLLAFVISGAVTGLAGGLNALLTGIAPLSGIDYAVSETILLMTVIGGSGHLFASVLGAGLYLLAAEGLSALWPRWMLLLGLLLVAVALYAHEGVWGLGKRWVHAWRARGAGPANERGALADASGEQA